MSFTNAFETTVLQFALTTTSVTADQLVYRLVYWRPHRNWVSWCRDCLAAVTRASVTFSVTGDTGTNSAAVEFPACTSSWGTVSHIGVMDASTGGNMLVHSALTTSKTIATGDVFRIPTGDLDITLN